MTAGMLHLSPASPLIADTVLRPSDQHFPEPRVRELCREVERLGDFLTHIYFLCDTQKICLAVSSTVLILRGFAYSSFGFIPSLVTDFVMHGAGWVSIHERRKHYARCTDTISRHSSLTWSVGGIFPVFSKKGGCASIFLRFFCVLRSCIISISGRLFRVSTRSIIFATIQRPTSPLHTRHGFPLRRRCWCKGKMGAFDSCSISFA
jgi:hypothetical protein